MARVAPYPYPVPTLASRLGHLDRSHRTLFSASFAPSEAQKASLAEAAIKTLAEETDLASESWEKIWGAKEVDSLQDRPRYQGGDMRARPLVVPSPLQAHDLKLTPDSPGAGKGDGGRDLGADAKYVGPGPAYELYRKTPDYAVWLKDNKK